MGENAERAVPSEAMLAEIQSKVPSDRCEVCLDTGYYGDNGPGIRGNREYQPCDYCTPCEREPRKANASVRGGAAAPYPARSVGLESKGGDA